MYLIFGSKYLLHLCPSHGFFLLVRREQNRHKKHQKQNVVGQGGSDIGFRWPPHSLLWFSDEHDTVENLAVQLYCVGVAKLLKEGAEERCATGSPAHSERTSCVSHSFGRLIRLPNLVVFEPGAPGSLVTRSRIFAVRVHVPAAPDLVARPCLR